MALRREKLIHHTALLFAAAEAHEDWEVLVDEKGAPIGVRRKSPSGWPRTPNELAQWYVDTFPEKAGKILRAQVKTLH
jgi:hypothetical protein